MYATAEFDFSQADNGWLMFAFALMRSIFLLFMFPPIISKGRQWMAARASSHARQLDEGERDEAEREPGTPPCASREVSRAACRFDLVFLRWSLVVDGALTTAAAFATKGWHMYIGENSNRSLRRADDFGLTRRRRGLRGLQPRFSCPLARVRRPPPGAS